MFFVLNNLCPARIPVKITGILPLAFIATGTALVYHPSAIDQSFKRSHAGIIFALARSAGHLEKRHPPLL
ncbi:unnamed protein product [Rhizophagus irregularis]|nr:unnamed protein product [Rhizophagus irregularis]